MATVALPIEIKIREFMGKLWLAKNLVDAGHRVILGEKTAIRGSLLNAIQPDIYIAKSATFSQSKYERYKQASDAGCKLCLLDSEGGVYPSPTEYFDKRISTKMIESFDTVFAWGELTAEIIQENTPEIDTEIVVTGNPRFDLLHRSLRGIYAGDASAIRNKFGRFILVNTNFTGANHFDKQIQREIRSNKDIRVDEGDIVYQRILLDELTTCVREISKLQNLDNVVIRPHPSENHEFYKNEFQDDPNIVVRHSGNVRPWILGSEAVIHNSCTTGIESAMLNTPVVAFEPPTDSLEVNRPKIPNHVSYSANSVKSLSEIVRSYLRGSEPYVMNDGQIQELTKWFANQECPAAPAITESINEMADNMNVQYDGSWKDRMQPWIKKRSFAPAMVKLYSSFLSNGLRSDYKNQKFPGLTLEELNNRLETINNTYNPNPQPYRITRVNRVDDVFEITKSLSEKDG